MLNRTGIRKETYNNTTQILFAVDHQISMGIVVSDAMGVQENGRKIVKAGFPLTGDLDARTTAFTEANSDGSDVVGILLHDVDVTAGEANGTILLHGFVNTNRIDETTKGKLVEAVTKALPMIKFVAC